MRQPGQLSLTVPSWSAPHRKLSQACRPRGCFQARKGQKHLLLSETGPKSLFHSGWTLHYNNRLRGGDPRCPQTLLGKGMAPPHAQ